MSESELVVLGERPFRDFLIYAVDARNLVRLAVEASGFTAHVSNVMRETWAFDPKEQELHDKGSVAELASLAATEAANGFPLLHSHALVGLWGALEACIDGMCEEWLRHDATGLVTEGLSRVKVSLGEYLSLSEDERWWWVLDQVKRERGSELKRGIGQFESVLDAIGVGGALDEDVRAVLHQAKAIRNLIAHNGGRVDSRFKRECPHYSLEVGEKFRLSSAQLTAASTAMVYYADTVWARMKVKAGLDAHVVEIPPWFKSASHLREAMEGSPAPSP